MFSRALLLLLALLPALAASPAAAWQSEGHFYISTAAAKAFPDPLPSFVRTDSAIAEIGALGPELDRSRGSDPGHFVDLDDAAKVAGVVDLLSLPRYQREYDATLEKAGTNQYAQGYLPYALLEGWRQVRSDFAIWRMDRVGESKASTEDDRVWFGRDRVLRELLTVRDIGVWSHYVGDGSQPLHLSIHFNGWGNYPNPDGYTTASNTHAMFEGDFVRAHVALADVTARVRQYSACNCTIERHVAQYLLATQAQVLPFYAIEKRGGFKDGTPEAVEFVRARLADGASMLRDLVVEAWQDSANQRVGYPGIFVRDAESGAALPKADRFGS